ncbi:hypothetical protein CCAL9344_07320 [Campylobacter sp. RM9344]|uniref:Integral membrane protein n=1 Tax=Campylobacter californiensis TaxID=1032243 RepID=A0AAW3ZS96_9BACT|nr:MULTISPECIES: hypothetical protein [unclassified Campylobacter]MBE2985116.1 hypothetical protein [Campylobacter sp. RM6883]MBE2995707.1 hypothetical protein [Campylobacter sp. RM6913]MBE3022804.1 hypothetical protein [Campylobacter sp. 7477a]MBE3029991.1 hypothetical protein [Campylobacter sp. RM9344]MBE3608074.1 hypothetical protein [Campylobacter sp. RM9337]
MVREVIFFLGIAIFLGAIWMIKDENISKKIKIIITVVIISSGIFAYIYETKKLDTADKNLQLLAEFRQGKSLVCGDINVTNEKFNYEFGTSCFMPKREFKELSGLVIKISDCESAK